MGLSEDRFEHYALTAAWDLYENSRTGWINEMVQVFLGIKFVRTHNEALQLRRWSKKQVSVQYEKVKEQVYVYWERGMWMQLNADRSKY